MKHTCIYVWDFDFIAKKIKINRVEIATRRCTKKNLQKISVQTKSVQKGDQVY